MKTLFIVLSFMSLQVFASGGVLCEGGSKTPASTSTTVESTETTKQ